MNLASRQTIKELLQRYQAQPSKGLGQNFLVDKMAIKKAVEAAELTSKDIVLEIGPGLGVLTQELATKAKKVIAVEKDPKMCEILKETLGDFSNVQVVQDDILKLKLQILNSKSQTNSKLQIPKNYKVAANLPFYITAPVIRHFLETMEAQPQYMVLGIQKEVAQRICASPPDMNLLAVSVQFYAEPKIIGYVSKKSFWPQPKVDSAIIKITINKKQLTNNRDLFFKIVKAGFSQPRKQLVNNLSKKLLLDQTKTEKWLLENRIQPSQRAETLSINDWLNLVKSSKI